MSPIGEHILSEYVKEAHEEASKFCRAKHTSSMDLSMDEIIVNEIIGY